MATTPIQDAVVLFGDSITQGAWEPGLNGLGQRLSHVYARKLDVLNRGFSGYNTDWALPVFKQCLIPNIRLLTIWFGANDACLPSSPQHVPLTRFKSNLCTMISLITSYSPQTKVVLITPPPINSIRRANDLAARDPPMALDRNFQITKAYAEAVQEVAREWNEGQQGDVGVVDAWTPIWRAAGETEEGLDTYLCDGLHLTAEGYEMVYTELISLISSQYPELHPESEALPFVFPGWKDINWASPTESLILPTRK